MTDAWKAVLKLGDYINPLNWLKHWSDRVKDAKRRRYERIMRQYRADHSK